MCESSIKSTSEAMREQANKQRLACVDMGCFPLGWLQVHVMVNATLHAANLTLPACNIGTRLHCRMARYSSMRFQNSDHTAPRLAAKEIRYSTPAYVMRSSYSR